MIVNNMTRFNLRRTAVGLGLLCVSVAAPAKADDVIQVRDARVHLSLGLGHALTDPQASELSFGLASRLVLELPVHPAVSFQGSVSHLFLGDGDAPTDRRFRDRDSASSLGATLGFRFQPMTKGIWADVGGGIAFTGDLIRPTVEAHLGYEFALGSSEKWSMGPVLGYQWIEQPNDEVRPEDAHVLSLGMQISFGRRIEQVVKSNDGPCPDGDKDGVCDADDRCPATFGIADNPYPDRKGCPREDRDRDTVFDDEDACPDIAGLRTTDPKTNGCPRKDTDSDTVFDDEDACPTVPGIRTTDPKTNGCPSADTDGDGVFDDEDNCPTVPGVRTNDPKTNGCPPGKHGLRIEGDAIVLDDIVQFDLDSPRVRHVSWGLIERIAKFMTASPEILLIDIQGHADESGTEEHNLMLSRTRAESVKQLLIKYGIAETRITTHSYGDSKPRVHGKHESERSLNRRVEFVIVTAVQSGGSK